MPDGARTRAPRTRTPRGPQTGGGKPKPSLASRLPGPAALAGAARQTWGQRKGAGGKGAGREGAKQGLAAGLSGATGMPLSTAQMVVRGAMCAVIFILIFVMSLAGGAVISSLNDDASATSENLTEGVPESVPDDYLDAYMSAANRYHIPVAVLVAIGERTQHGRYSPYDDLDRDPTRPQAEFMAGGGGVPAASCQGSLAMPTHPAGDARMNRAEFSAGLLGGLGLPVTCENLALLVGWLVHESPGIDKGAYRNNPMNNTQKGHGANNQRFPDYPTPENGVAAQVETLVNPNPNFKYPAILDGFRMSDIARTAAAVEASSFCEGSCYGAGGSKLVEKANQYLSDPGSWQREGSVAVGTGPLTSVPQSAGTGFQGTVSPISAPVAVGNFAVHRPAENGRVSPDVFPPIGTADGEGRGPMLLDDEAAADASVDPQDVEDSVGFVAEQLNEAREQLQDDGEDVPSDPDDVPVAVAFWAKAIDLIPVVNANDNLCSASSDGRSVSDQIQIAFRCEAQRAPEFHFVGSANENGQLRELEKRAGTKALIDEALAVANASSQMGTAPCDANSPTAGVFPLTVAQAAGEGADRCVPTANIAAAARIVVRGESIPVAQRETRAGRYQPMIGGWAALGVVVPTAVQAQFSADGPYRSWQPDGACVGAVEKRLRGIADTRRPLFAGYAGADAATYTHEHRAEIEASFTGGRDPRASDCAKAAGRTTPTTLTAGSPSWITALVAGASQLAHSADVDDNSPDARRRNLIDPDRRNAWRGVAAAVDQLAVGGTVPPTVGTESLVDRLATGPTSNPTPPVSPPNANRVGFGQEVAARASVLGILIDGQETPEAVGVPQFSGGFDANGCPVSYPSTHVRSRDVAGVDLATLCAQSVAQARTPQAAAAVKFALSQVGQPYCRGDRPSACGGDGNRFGEGPARGFDCSGLLFAAYKSAGVDFGGASTSYTEVTMPKAVQVPVSDARAGDLVQSNGGGHIGMALVGGLQVHSSDFGVGVIISRQHNATIVAWVDPTR